jgi:hypothetical protein
VTGRWQKSQTLSIEKKRPPFLRGFLQSQLTVIGPTHHNHVEFGGYLTYFAVCFQSYSVTRTHNNS